ncbi:hypothetical protein M3J09_010268 [Ascochyta lentis]
MQKLLPTICPNKTELAADSSCCPSLRMSWLHYPERRRSSARADRRISRTTASYSSSNSYHSVNDPSRAYIVWPGIICGRVIRRNSSPCFQPIL